MTTSQRLLIFVELDTRLQTSWQNLRKICEVSTNDVALLRQEFEQISTRLNDMSRTVSGRMEWWRLSCVIGYEWRFMQLPVTTLFALQGTNSLMLSF